MSAIIAGESCKECKQEFYISFGHPEWYDDVVKRHLPESDQFKLFRDMSWSGLCPNCYKGKNPQAEIILKKIGGKLT